MPEEDGYSLLRKVRSLADESVSRIPAVALSSHSRFEDRVRAFQAGFQSHVAKPVEVKELVTVVAGLAGHRQKEVVVADSGRLPTASLMRDYEVTE
jgi:CheY-like chemotaxis protein